MALIENKDIHSKDLGPLPILGGAALGIYGLRHYGRQTVWMNPRDLEYLTMGVPQLGGKWWYPAGREFDYSTGLAKVKRSDIWFNQLKRFEESFGKIPRTFELFS